MSTIVPASRPAQTEAETRALLAAKGVKAPIVVVGIRGYYSTTFAPAGNNRGVYDDAIIVITDQKYRTFNANTDPSVFRKGIAVLKPGVWNYKKGIHGLSKPKARQYEALVQDDEVTVIRDGQGDDTGFFGINIHRGGYGTTSSLGCQTIHPDQWHEFANLVFTEMQRLKTTKVKYLLTVKS